LAQSLWWRSLLGGQNKVTRRRSLLLFAHLAECGQDTGANVHFGILTWDAQSRARGAGEPWKGESCIAVGESALGSKA